jgi:hypothetical protein
LKNAKNNAKLEEFTGGDISFKRWNELHLKLFWSPSGVKFVQEIGEDGHIVSHPIAESDKTPVINLGVQISDGYDLDFTCSQQFENFGNAIWGREHRDERSLMCRT